MTPVCDHAEHVDVQITLLTDPNPAQQTAWVRLWTLLLTNEAMLGKTALTGGINSNAVSGASQVAQD